MKENDLSTGCWQARKYISWNVLKLDKNGPHWNPFDKWTPPPLLLHHRREPFTLSVPEQVHVILHVLNELLCYFSLSWIQVQHFSPPILKVVSQERNQHQELEQKFPTLACHNACIDFGWEMHSDRIRSHYCSFIASFLCEFIIFSWMSWEYKFPKAGHAIFKSKLLQQSILPASKREMALWLPSDLRLFLFSVLYI